MDEDGPWVNKPSGVGPRFIVVHAMCASGWVDGAELVFEAKKRTGDYHGQMNWENFSRWFETQLMPNAPREALIVLDNAKYHNILAEERFPTAASTKEELCSWLNRNGYTWREDMLKSELMALCSRLAPTPEYRLDCLARKHGAVILRTPPYHPELQPIETCWAVVKNYMADHCDFTMAGLRSNLPKAFLQVTPMTCKKTIRKIVQQEEEYWQEDERLDEYYSADGEEEEDARTASEEGEFEPFLEDL